MKNNCSIQFSRIPNRLWLSSKKVPRTMKLFTLFFACSLGLAHASESYAQNIVNVEVQNKTVGEILKKIEKQSDFDFFFDNTLIDLNRLWGIERSGFFNDRGKWVKGFENQRV